MSDSYKIYASKDYVDEKTSQLSEDKADRSEIPEPYVLPVATAEALGGVKVGNGLQMDGNMLEIVPEGKWEQIEIITVNEDGITLISRDVFPDGTPYNLQAVKVISKYQYPISPSVGTRVDFKSDGQLLGGDCGNCI